MEQVEDFRSESDALAEVLETLREEDFASATLFKGWTIHDVVAHLHIFNWAADASIHRPDAFRSFWNELQGQMAAGRSLREVTDAWLDGRRGRAVYERWRAFYPEMCERLQGVDPRRRVEWAGPSMSVRSSITARQMETWAHGHEVFDALALERPEDDRIKNIAILGMNTFSWTYTVRGRPAPTVVPHVRLTAPSGEVWEWNRDEKTNEIEGSAVDFCRVVTQVRNVADTELRVDGEVAKQWMAVAQCFAGPAETPPAPGTRYRAGSRSR